MKTAHGKGQAKNTNVLTEAIIGYCNRFEKKYSDTNGYLATEISKSFYLGVKSYLDRYQDDLPPSDKRKVLLTYLRVWQSCKCYLPIEDTDFAAHYAKELFKEYFNSNYKPEWPMLAGFNLKGIQFESHDDLDNLVLLSVDFSNANFYAAKFWNCDFRDCNLSKTRTTLTKIGLCRFVRCDFSDAGIDTAYFTDTLMRQCTLYNTNLVKSNANLDIQQCFIGTLLPLYPNFSRLSGLWQKRALFLQAYDIPSNYSISTPHIAYDPAENETVRRELLRKYEHFLTEQAPFIEQIKKLLPDIEDGKRYNRCLDAVTGVLADTEEKNRLYFRIIRRCEGMLYDFYYHATVAGRISGQDGSSSFVALLEMDKALVNAYAIICKQSDRAEDENWNYLQSNQGRHALIDFIKQWRRFVTTYYPSLKKAADVLSERDAYIQLVRQKSQESGPVRLYPKAEKKLYCDDNAYFVPMRHYENTLLPPLAGLFATRKKPLDHLDLACEEDSRQSTDLHSV